MAEIDYYKGQIDLLKVVMTAFLGVLFVIFWNVIADPDIVKNMDFITKGLVLLIVFMIILAISLVGREWLQILNNLKDA